MSNQISDYAMKVQSASYPNAFQAQQMQSAQLEKAQIDQRPIDIAFLRLSENIGALSHALSNLEARLIPYLQPESTDKDGPSPTLGPNSSATVNKILAASADIIAATRFVERLTGRVD